MSRLGFRLSAPEGALFSPTSGDASIGKRISVDVFGTRRTGIVRQATVQDSGAWVWIVVDLDDRPEDLQ